MDTIKFIKRHLEHIEYINDDPPFHEYKTERECKKEKPEEVVPDEPPPPELPRIPTREEERQSWVNWMYGLDD